MTLVVDCDSPSLIRRSIAGLSPQRQAAVCFKLMQSARHPGRRSRSGA
jgi:hypothetical protein